jgi:hypothetical protein
VKLAKKFSVELRQSYARVGKVEINLLVSADAGYLIGPKVVPWGL